VSVDQKLFAWVKSALNTGSIQGIIPSNDSVVRDDFTSSISGVVPRIEYNPWRTRETNLAGTVTLGNGVFGITIVCDRDDAFGDGLTPESAGDLHNLLDAVQSILKDATPVLAGYTTKAIKLDGVRRTTLSDIQNVGVRLDFSLSVFEGLVTPPIAGGDGDLDFDELSGTVVRWVASPSARHDTEDTGIDDLGPIWTPNDLTNRVRVWMMMEPVSQPVPTAGSLVTANFDVSSGLSWTQSLKLDQYTWPQDLGDSGPVMVAIDFVDDDYARSPWLGASI